MRHTLALLLVVACHAPQPPKSGPLPAPAPPVVAPTPSAPDAGLQESAEAARKHDLGDFVATEMIEIGTPVPQSLRGRGSVRAARFVAAYVANPIAWERDYKGEPIVLIGLIHSITRDDSGGVVVSLRAGQSESQRALQSAGRHLRASAEAAERLPGLGPQRDSLRSMAAVLGVRGDDDDTFVACLFPGASVAAVADLVPGQLVALRGSARAPDPGSDNPNLTDTKLVWAGDRPVVIHSDPETGENDRNATIVAKSALACSARQTVVFAGPDGPRPEAVMEMEKADRELESLGGGLRCSHPLLFLSLFCDDIDLYNKALRQGHSVEHTLIGRERAAHKEAQKLVSWPECTDQVERAVEASRKLSDTKPPSKKRAHNQ